MTDLDASAARADVHPGGTPPRPPPDDALETERQPQTSRGRAHEMAALREQGLSLEEVALCFGVSRERVRQILHVHGGPARQAVISARRRRTEQHIAARSDELLVLWRAGAELRHAAGELGLSLTDCRTAIMSVATDDDRAARRANLARTRVAMNRYSDDDIIAALRGLASGLQRVPSARDYASLGREPGYPSLATVVNRMDGWTNAVRCAGLAHASATAQTSPRSRRWTVEACWAAVRRVTRELGTIPTLAGYDRHAAGRAGLPSSSTLRNRLGRWSAITTQLTFERDAAQPAHATIAPPPRSATLVGGGDAPSERQGVPLELRRMRATRATGKLGLIGPSAA